MTDEFILEEAEAEMEESANNRPFVYAVGALLAVLFLSIACIVVFLMRGNGGEDQSSQIAAIEATNAAIAVTNAAVTKTIEAMETEAARPTETPENTPTTAPTEAATDVPKPTDTPVVPQAEEETATPSLLGTSSFVGAGGDMTPTPIASLGSEGALPQTGIGTWTATIAALLLIAILFGARRLRSS